MKNENAENKEELIVSDKSEQYRTVNELFERSRPSSDYYILLILSAVIISCGLLLDNSAIVIGGMLVTPMLTPILVIGLAISVGEPRGIIPPLKLIARSVLVVMVIAAVLSLFLEVPSTEVVFSDTVRVAVLYFFVATCTGIIASFAWVKKELSDVLPGTAIAVSVVPPIALIGIWLSQLDFMQARFFSMVLILNLIGIIIGSAGVFSYLKFYRVEKRVEDIVDEIEQENLEERKEGEGQVYQEGDRKRDKEDS